MRAGIGGAALFVVSIVFVIGGIKLGIGSPFRLGTGAFPFLTGLLLSCLSVAIFIQAVSVKKRSTVNPDWVSFLAICAALAVFAATADRLGIVPAVFCTVVVASLPDRTLPAMGKITLATVVAIACWVLFVELLNLPLKAFAGF